MGGLFICASGLRLTGICEQDAWLEGLCASLGLRLAFAYGECPTGAPLGFDPFGEQPTGLTLGSAPPADLPVALTDLRSFRAANL